MSFGRKGVDYREIKRRVRSQGSGYDSRLEGGLAFFLRALVDEGELKDLREKPNVHLTEARILMIPDFVAFDVLLGADVFFEAKGFETAVWRIKRKLWTVYGPGRLRVYKGSGFRVNLVEELVPSRLADTAE